MAVVLGFRVWGLGFRVWVIIEPETLAPPAEPRRTEGPPNLEPCSNPLALFMTLTPLVTFKTLWQP